MALAKALYSFPGSADDELQLHKDALVSVFKIEPTESWWYGHLVEDPSQRGFFPSSYVMILPSSDTEKPPPPTGQMVTKLSPLLAELKATETTYCNNLTVLLDQYIRQLQLQDTEWKRDVVRVPVVAISFDYVQQILLLVQQFHAELVACIDQTTSDRRGANSAADETWALHQLNLVSKLFVNFSMMFRIYSQYAAVHNQATEALLSLIQGDASTRDFFAHVETNSGMSISSLLITPIQRLPRYELFLRELVRILEKTITAEETKLQNVQYVDTNELLQEAMSEVQSANRHVNEAVRINDEKSQLLEIQNQFVSPVDLISGAVIGRRLISEGSITKMSATNRKIVRVYAFLLSDALIYCDIVEPDGEKRPHKLRFRRAFNFAYVNVQPVTQGGDPAAECQSVGPSLRDAHAPSVSRSVGPSSGNACAQTPTRSNVPPPPARTGPQYANPPDEAPKYETPPDTTLECADASEFQDDHLDQSPSLPAPPPQPPTPSMDIETGFSLVGLDKTVHLFFKDKSQRDAWFTTIQDCIRSQSKKVRGKSQLGSALLMAPNPSSLARTTPRMLNEQSNPKQAQLVRILESERQYLRDMSILQNVFVSTFVYVSQGGNIKEIQSAQPTVRISSVASSAAKRMSLSTSSWKNQRQYTKSLVLSEALASNVDVMVCLYCIQQLKVLHEGMVHRMERELNNAAHAELEVLVGPIFTTFVPLLLVYTSYRSRFDAMWRLLSSEKLESLRLECERDPASLGRPMKFYFELPLGRVQEYQQQLVRLLRATPQSSPDRAVLEKCVEGVGSTNSMIDKQVQEHGNAKAVLRVQEMLKGPSRFQVLRMGAEEAKARALGGDLSATSGCRIALATNKRNRPMMVPLLINDRRRLLLEGDCLKICDNAMQQVKLFVFDDCLVYADVVRPFIGAMYYRFKRLMWLEQCRIEYRTTSTMGAYGSPALLDAPRTKSPDDERVKHPYYSFNAGAMKVLSPVESFVVVALDEQTKLEFVEAFHTSGKCDVVQDGEAGESVIPVAPVLFPKKFAPACQCCDGTFKFLVRRWKHCPACGSVVCKSCCCHEYPKTAASRVPTYVASANVCSRCAKVPAD